MVKHCPKILASKEKARTKKATTSGHWCVPSPLSFQPHSLTFISISVFPVVNTSHCLVSLQMKRSAQNVLVSSVERFLSSSFFQLLVSPVVICLENLIICCFFYIQQMYFPQKLDQFSSHEAMQVTSGLQSDTPLFKMGVDRKKCCYMMQVDL